MDRRVALLKEFYRGLLVDRVKVETSEYGFAFLDALLGGEATLEYAELTLSKVLHKYKLTDVQPARLNMLLRRHLAKECNVCLYFDARANRTFSFNIDNNHTTDNTALIPEVEVATEELAARLRSVGCHPLVLASGRGYHLWCRLSAPVENARIYRFMLHAAAAALLVVHQRGLGTDEVKFNFYPDPRAHDVVSLRLFGSEHAKNGVFSRVRTPEGLLDEEASWAYFEDHLRTRTIDVDTFDRAFDAIVGP